MLQTANGMLHSRCRFGCLPRVHDDKDAARQQSNIFRPRGVQREVASHRLASLSRVRLLLVSGPATTRSSAG